MSCFLLPEEHCRQSFKMRIGCHKLSPDSESSGIDDGIRHIDTHKTIADDAQEVIVIDAHKAKVNDTA